MTKTESYMTKTDFQPVEHQSLLIYFNHVLIAHFSCLNDVAITKYDCRQMSIFKKSHIICAKVDACC